MHLHQFRHKWQLYYSTSGYDKSTRLSTSTRIGYDKKFVTNLKIDFLEFSLIVHAIFEFFCDALHGTLVLFLLFSLPLNLKEYKDVEICLKKQRTCSVNTHYYKMHGHIIEWTQHIGFLTFAGMDTVIEGNHGKNSKRRVTRILCLSQFGEI